MSNHDFPKTKNNMTATARIKISVYLFELDHNVFGEFHVFEHALKFAGERCTTLCKRP